MSCQASSGTTRASSAGRPASTNAWCCQARSSKIARCPKSSLTCTMDAYAMRMSAVGTWSAVIAAASMVVWVTASPRYTSAPASLAIPAHRRFSFWLNNPMS